MMRLERGIKMYIETRNLVKTYKGRNVVDGVSLRVEQGQVVGLLGPNGAGKTTTFYMIVGLERPNSGQIFVNGEDVTTMPMYRRSRFGIGYLPQEASVFRNLSVEDNIMAILEATKLAAAERKDKMESLLEEFHVTHVRQRRGSQLSGGERRRVEIARSLAIDPYFILLDEPFAGVDPIAVADIQEVIGYLSQRGIGVLITDHNVRETLSIVDKAYILNEGKILIDGDSATIASSEVAKKFYLGENFNL
jgi:lipopolysaccharide export system ATP-binding protein